MTSLASICYVVALFAVATSTHIPLAPVSAVVGAIDIPRYAFNYAVNDPHTHDNKAQWESRDGGHVRGSYSLVEPDGSLRVVDYSADDATGFNAVVKKIGPGVHPTPIAHGPIHAPIAAPHSAWRPTAHFAPIAPIVPTYGLGAAAAAIGLPRNAHLGSWSLPFDPVTGSYGGWVPIGPHGPILPHGGPYATIFSKKVINGNLVRWVTGPIPLAGRSLILRREN